MKEKITTVFNTHTKKIAAIVTCTALVLSFGAVSVFAAGGLPVGSSLVKNEDGNMSYSVDGGTTWTEGAPADYNVEYGEDGTVQSWVGGEKPEPGDGAFVTKNENGKVSYSTDGGETWSEKAPEGFTQNPDGSISVRNK